MNKAGGIIIGVLLVFLVVVIQNNQELKQERAEAETTIEEMEQNHAHIQEPQVRPEKLKSSPTDQEAGEVAQKFVEAYFTYEGTPTEEEVAPLATDSLMQGLDFEGTEGEYTSEEQVASSISEVKVYTGEGAKDSQEILVTFINKIRYGEVESEVEMQVSLAMKEKEGEWKADEMEMRQF